MKPTLAESSKHVLRFSPFQYADRRLLFARARLYEDRITLSGLGWTGWHKQTVQLKAVENIDWWAGTCDEVNFALHLRNGESLHMCLKGAGLWNYKIKELVPMLNSTEEKMPAASSRVVSAA